MTSFIEALQNVDFTQAEKAKNVNVELGNGNNKVTVIGDDSTVKAGNGNNTIEMSGDDDSVLVGDGSNKITTSGANTKITAGNINNANSKGNNDIFQVGDNAQITVANGNNKVISYSKGAKITAGNGDNLIGSLGNNVKITAGNGNNAIAFWGDNDKIKVGNGNNNIKTLDWIKGGPQGTDAKSRAHNQEIRNLMAGNSLGILANDKDIQDMADKVWSSFTAKSSSSSKLTGTTSTSKTDKWSKGNTEYTRVTTTVTKNYLNTYIKYLDVTGVKNPSVTIGDGNNDIGLTVSGNYYVGGSSANGDNNITIIKGGYQHYTSVTQDKTSTSSTTSKTSKRKVDPLVIDFNQDGKVSAAAGFGIDIDGDGIADGAATNGDKMLAMSDINGNGQIDGAEVFGDNTVDPFTGKKLNAENGFQALELLAKSAQRHTGITCIDSEGNVNLADLKRALNTIGINLGFVSDANNTKLEELERVVSINVRNYTDNGQTDENGQHAQQGSYLATNGRRYGADDIWFW